MFQKWIQLIYGFPCGNGFRLTIKSKQKERGYLYFSSIGLLRTFNLKVKILIKLKILPENYTV